MINPSANGWIDKYFLEQSNTQSILETNILDFYKNIRYTGFIYGHIVSINTIQEAKDAYDLFASINHNQFFCS